MKSRRETEKYRAAVAVIKEAKKVRDLGGGNIPITCGYAPDTRSKADSKKSG